MTVFQLKSCALALMITAGWQVATLANGGRPSQTTLQAMGLSGMAVMSDDAAMAIRGFGYGSGAKVWGSSFANVAVKYGSAGSENGYSAEGSHHAKGGNYSEASAVIKYSGGGKNHGDKGGDWGNKGGDWGDKGGKNGGGWGGKVEKHGGGGWGDKGGMKGGGWGDKGGMKGGGWGDKGGMKGGGWGDKGGMKGGGWGDKGGMKGGGWGDKGGMKGGGWGDKGGKHGGGKPSVKSIKVRAGGSSYAKAK